MIMPVSAAQIRVNPNFGGTVKNSEFLNDAVAGFTRMEKIRWNKISEAVQQKNDASVFSVIQNVRQIGKTILKSVVVSEEKSGVLNEDVYNITKGGTVVMYSRESLARTILDTIEGFIQKTGN